MTERTDLGGGGLTGATGDLTPDETDEAFVPGERREIEDAGARGEVTYRQGAAAPAQHGEIGDPAGENAPGGPTEMAQRESGYGSEHGLAPNDPAYRMESHPPAGPDEVTVGEDADGEARIGGDDVRQGEEHY